MNEAQEEEREEGVGSFCLFFPPYPMRRGGHGERGVSAIYTAQSIQSILDRTVWSRNVQGGVEHCLHKLENTAWKTHSPHLLCQTSLTFFGMLYACGRHESMSEG